MPRPKVLFLAANPADTKLLDLDEEVANIDAAIGAERRFDWFTHRAVRRSELKQLLAQHRPVVVHFSGHGHTRGLALLDEEGMSALLSGEALRRTFEAAGAPTRLAVLNACNTDEHARALSAHVDCVIGTTIAIGDNAARAFSLELYRALAAGRRVREALEVARQSHDAYQSGVRRDIVEAEASPTSPAAIYTLYERSGIDAGRVALAAPPAPAAAVPPGLAPAEVPAGRERTMYAIRDALNGPPGIIALCGMPGVGKSVLARASAWQQIEEGSPVAWQRDPAHGATFYRDDVESAAALDALRDWAARGHVVITTRDQLLAETCISVPVPPLPGQQLDWRPFDAIYDQLAERPEARALLRLVGLFGLQRIARPMLLPFASEVMGADVPGAAALDEWLASLRRHSLITVTDDAITIPEATQQLVTCRIAADERADLSRRALQFARGVVDDHHAADRERMDLAADVVAAVDVDAFAPVGSVDRGYFGEMLCAAAFHLGLFVDNELQDPRRALGLFRRAERELEIDGFKHPPALNMVLRRIGWAASRLGDTDVIPVFERAIRLVRLAPTPASLAATLNDAGVAMIEIHDYERARAWFLEALAQASDDETRSWHLPMTLDGIGRAEHEMSHHAEGERARELRASAIRRTWEALDLRVERGDLAAKALGAHNLAILLNCSCAFDAWHARTALCLFQCAREIWCRTMPDWSDELASTTTGIADLCAALGEPWDELDELRRLLRIRLEGSPLRLSIRATAATYQLAQALCRQAIRLRTLDAMREGLFAMFAVLPRLRVDVPEAEMQSAIAEALALLDIAAELGAVEDSELASRRAAFPSLDYRDRIQPLRNRLGF